MKRILQFKNTDSGYACFENDENVFEIAKADLQFDVKAFFLAFYNEDKDYENIELENCIPDDKDGKRVYDCINSLIGQIKEKLAELTPEEIEDISKQNSEEPADDSN